MKNILAAIIMIAFVSNSFAQTRNTMWLDGLSTTSKGWDRTPVDLQNIYNYDLKNIISLGELDNSVYDPALGVNSAASQLEGAIGNYPNILGFGHDFGGLVLRDMASGSNNLTAIVLDGTPNQGSAGISAAIESTGVNGLSEAQRLINGVKAIQSGDDCENCELIASFEAWVDELKANESIVSEMALNSPVINELNQPANMPQVPYAVFWGSIEQFSITSMMSSWYFPSSGNDSFTECYTARLNLEREKAKDKFTISTISNTQGFFGKVIGFVGAVISADTKDALKAIGKFISDTKAEIKAQIEALKERDAELARILRCELANQLLAVEWQYLLAQGGVIDQEVVQDVPTYDECLEFCREDCDNGDGPANCIANCMADCLAGTSVLGGAVEVTVFIPEENDGLLNKSEQLLEGDDKTYHLSNTNHFQETDLGYGNLASHIQDLFDGAAGAAYIVNKN